MNHSNLCVTWIAAAALAPGAVGQTVFSTDFETGLPPELTAPGATLTGVQGYGGLGFVGRRFEGQFLRYNSTQVLPTTLTLTNLPPHTHLSVQFLLAVIDSWDGDELLQIRVDGELVFSNWFVLAVSGTTSYFPPLFGQLSTGAPLGFSSGAGYDNDCAYDLGADLGLVWIEHTASTLTVEWTLSAVAGSGPGTWQGGDDESWAIDALSVIVHDSSLPIGTSYCAPAVPNATGAPGTISAFGSPFVASNFLRLRADQLPQGSFGFFLTSQSQAFTPNPGGSRGTLCLGGAIGRFVGPGQVQSSGTTGAIEVQVDLLHIPGPNYFVPAFPGGEWHFQAWYRDSVGASATSNFTDGVTVLFQ